MSDFLSEISKERVRFVVDVLMPRISQGVSAQIKTTMGEASFALLLANTERNALVSLGAYTDWLATKIVRSKNFEKQRLHFISKKECDLISQKCDVPVSFLCSFISRITRFGNRLPLVGDIAYDNHLIPNKFALEEWAKFFDWSK